MWTQTLKSGKVRFFERYTDRNGKSRVVSITMADDRKSTQKTARNKLREKMDVAPSVYSITFGEMIRRYKIHMAEEYKPQTAEVTDRHFRKIEDAIGSDMLLSQLTAPYLRRVLYDGSASKYNERLKHTKAALRWAYREELIEDIDFLDRLPKMRSERRKMALTEKYLEPDELKELLEAMKTEKWRLLTEFQVLSGLRIGETMALTPKDVDLANREITINKTYSLLINKVSINAKTDAGNRTVYIQDELLDCIHRINAIMPRRRRIFFEDEGTYINYQSYAKYCRENTLAAVGRKLSPHALRHTHVALMAGAGIPLDTISRRLGHASSDITREVYMHVTKKLMEKDAEQIRGIKLL